MADGTWSISRDAVFDNNDFRANHSVGRHRIGVGYNDQMKRRFPSGMTKKWGTDAHLEMTKNGV